MAAIRAYFTWETGTPRARLAIDGSAELVLFVGRLDGKKGIPELLEAFASLANRRPDLRLAYVGDGPGSEQLRGASWKVARWPALAAAIDTAMARNWDEHSISEQFRRACDDAAGELLGICELAVRQRIEKCPPEAKATPVMSQ